MIRVFRKIGSAFKAIGKFVVKHRETIMDLDDLVVFIPIIGGPLSIALNLVEEAESSYPEGGNGEFKMAWVLIELKNSLAAAGFEEKRLKALIEMALLILKGEAEIRKMEE